MKRLLPSALDRKGNSRASTMRQRRQQHLLDVKVRSRKATEQRNRQIVAAACWLLIVATMIAAVVLGGHLALKKFLWENPDFRIGEISVKTDGSLTRDDILHAAGIRAGENIFLVKLNAAHDRLEKLPQVQHVEIERHLPNQINVLVEERHPVAWITDARDEPNAQGDGKFVTDALGNVMRLERVLPEYYRLPVIRGVASTDLSDGETVSAPEMRAALQLLDLNGDNPRLRIRAVDISKGYCLLVTDDARAVYTFGLDHVSEQIDYLNRVFDYAESTKQQLQTVNLLVKRNRPITFVQPSDDALDDSEADVASAGAKPAPSVAAKAAAAKAKPLKKASAPAAHPLRSKEPQVRRAQPVHSPSPSPRHG